MIDDENHPAPVPAEDADRKSIKKTKHGRLRPALRAKRNLR